MSLLVAMLLAAPLQGFALSQDGGPEKYVRHLSCGTGLTCTSSSTYGHIEATGSGSGAPTDAEYWVGAANGTLSAEKNLGALSTGFVVNTAGVPTAYAGAMCAADEYVTRVSGSGALTCAVPPGTCGGGNANELQYNNGGSCGGAANVETNGTHLSIVAVNTHPAPPSSNQLQYNFAPGSNFPPMPHMVNGADDAGVPLGLYSFFGGMAGGRMWQPECVWPEGMSTQTFINLRAHAPAVVGTPAGVAWATTSLLTRQNNYATTSATAVNVYAEVAANTTSGPLSNAWRGNADGAGGFLWWTRVETRNTKDNSRHFYGLKGTNSALIGNENPSAILDSVYIGCDQGDTYLSACSNDNSGSATCVATDAGFPCTTDNAWFDFWLYAPVNADQIYWYIERNDYPLSASGTMTSDLPRDTLKLRWSTGIGTGGSTNTATTLGFMGACLVSNL